MGANFYKNMFGNEILLLQNNGCLPIALLNMFEESRIGDALLEGSSSKHTVTLILVHTILTFSRAPSLSDMAPPFRNVK